MPTNTPNIGLVLPDIGQRQWGYIIIPDLSLLDSIFGGTTLAPALHLGSLIVDGAITAGSFSGVGGAMFLLSSMFGQPNGVAQLNSAGKVPPSSIVTLATVVVPYSTSPIFDLSAGQSFELTLTGDVTSPGVINGASGAALVCIQYIQDGTGGHAALWPANVRNAGDVGKLPNARSTQLFKVHPADGSLDAASPMMYS